MITTIIFDLGNVVLTNDWHDGIPEKHEEFSKYFGVSYSDTNRGWNAAWPQLRTGKITEDEFWRIFLRTAGAKRADIRKAKTIWRKYQRQLENMLGLVGRLKKHYKVAALANSGREWLDFKIKKYRLKSYFDIIINSGYAGLAKPDTRIYNLITRKLHTDPKACIFIDDQIQNLTPAKKLGMKTILFKNQADLEKRLSKLGIKL